MSLYDTIRTAVASGLSSAGLTETLTYREPLFSEDYDPRFESGGESDSRATYTFSAVISPVEGMSNGVSRGLSRSPGLEIRPGDLSLTVANKDLGFSFRPKGEVYINSKWWTVLSVSPPYSGEQVVTYTVQVRRR